MKQFLFLLFFLPLVASAATQNSSIDSPGDVAILAYNGYDVSPSVVYNDGLTFLLVDDCPNGTTLTITDEEWDGAAFSTPTGEGNLTWTNNTGSTLARGTVIKITNASDDPSTSGIAVNTGSVAESDTGFNMIDGDQLYIYTGTRAAPGVFLAFYGDESTLGNGDAATILGTSLVSGQTAQLNILQGYYTGPASCNSTLSDCLSQIYNTSNWSFTDNPSYPSNLPDTFTGSVFVINNAPTAAGFTASPIYQGTSYAFSTANFSYSDTDGDPLDHVRIVTVPVQGSLWVDSDGSNTINGGESALTNGSQVSKANLDAGYLKYLNTTGSSSSFTFDVNDGTAYSASAYTATLTVTAYPTITLSASSTSPAESVGSVNLTATASHSFNQNITVNLSYSGTATSGVDYSQISSLIITTGNTTKTSALSISEDAIEEVNETIIVDISTVSNGTESGVQQRTITIVDNDQTIPSVAISGASGTINAPFTATFTFSEPVTGFNLGDIVAGNASVSVFSATSASVYTALITPTADGSVTVDVAGSVAQDGVGNNNTAATQLAVTYDATAPTVTISGASGTINAAFTATFTFSENVTGFTLGDIVAGNASVSAFNATSASVYTALITPTANGTVTLNVAGAVAQDAAGNNNTAGSLSVDYESLNTDGSVSVSGLAVEGQILSALPQDADGVNAATLVYQWLADASPVGGNSASYTIAAADVGRVITVQVSYTDNLGRNEQHTSAATDTVISLQQYALNTISSAAGNPVNATGLTLTQYRQAGLSSPGDDDFNRILLILNSAVARSQSDDVNEFSELEALVALIMEAQDDDGDGLPNSLEGDVTTDRDGDGIIDREDTDSDQDGLSDRVELGLVLTDTDGDGIVDFFDADADQDGNVDDGRTDDNLDGAEDSLMTIAGYRAANALVDADNDGRLNSQDLDSDNDGIGDLIENGLADADGNLMVDDDRIELDDSSDLIDDNNDGIFNFLQLSSDGIQTDFSLSGLPLLLDVDKDGRIDNTVDMDSDGLMDIIDNAVGAFGSLPDIDGDGIPNHLDEDDDGDGIPDVVENPQMGFFTGLDADADGIDDGVDYDVNGDTFGTDNNGNGVRDDREMPDYDKDGIADHLDPDSDNDNVNDGEDPSINTGDDITTATGAFSPLMLLIAAALAVAGRMAARVSVPTLLLACMLWAPLSQADSAQPASGPEMDNMHWLLAWGVGRSWLSPEVHGNNKVTDDGGLGGHFAAGLQLNDAWQVRYQYGIPGAAEVNSAAIEYTTHSLLAQYSQPLQGQWRWMLGAGFSQIDVDVAAGFNADLDSEIQLSLQAGASYPLSNNTRLTVQASRYSGDVQMLMLDFSHLIP
ncbi:Ig-like domain-containing protein [Thalassolituus hydrocarboniclasticus]|uniref:Bacterial Ig-like domain-containing protein n=1 Tax=Thalassolituus hydrocarboniclasticus TaxID=2742796 RepID=A0ABY6A9B2_9GAMM|nr:Ig-like domain-containing protein [Thalassolituus hydrocarboniclasticus]UXD86831.1 hypothetical protein HUF19_04945 [Thalassolituus hydrocarboniclasticus]